MAGNDNKPKAEFTQEGELVVSLSKSIFAGDIDATFNILKEHMSSQDLKVSEHIFSEFETANLIAKK